MNKKGFTLVEFLVALVIASVGLLAMTALQTSSIKNSYAGANINQAIFHAKSELEYLKNLPYSNAALSVGLHNVEIPGTIFTMQYNVTEDGAALTKTIELKVQWTEKVAHSISLKTLVYKKS